MIDRENMYHVLFDKDMNVIDTNEKTRNDYPFLTDAEYMKNLLKDSLSDFSSLPVISDCGNAAPGYRLVISKEEDCIRCCLAADKKAYTNEVITNINYHMREPISTIFALLPVTANSINRGDDDKAILYLENIGQLSYQLLRSLNNVSLAAKLTAKEELKKETVDFSSLLESLINSVSTIEKELHFETDIEPGLLITTNSNLITDGILNLIANSIKFRSDIPAEIHISLKKSGRNIVFSYSDNSKGIREEYRQSVFLPYFSQEPYGESANPYETGLGLGLYIARRAFEFSGGNLLLTSSFGEGVKYMVSLPAAENTDNVLFSNRRDFLLNRYSNIFIQLCESCMPPPLV